MHALLRKAAIAMLQHTKDDEQAVSLIAIFCNACDRGRIRQHDREMLKLCIGDGIGPLGIWLQQFDTTRATKHVTTEADGPCKSKM